MSAHVERAGVRPEPAKFFGRKHPNQNRRPWVYSWMFDYGLTPLEFFVLAHLWRRADTNTNWCYPSWKDIAQTCGISRESVGKALKTLRNLGLFRRVRTGRVNRYLMIADPRGNTEQAKYDETAHQKYGETAHQKYGETGHKGIPSKDSQFTAAKAGSELAESSTKDRGDHNPATEAPSCDPSLSTIEPDAERWTDWQGDDDGEPPPAGWAAPSGAPHWRDLAPWEQRGVMYGDAPSIASSRRWSAVRSTDDEPGRPPPERWRERAAPYLRRSEHWRALTPVDQDGVFANLDPLPAESPAARAA